MKNFFQEISEKTFFQNCFYKCLPHLLLSSTKYPPWACGSCLYCGVSRGTSDRASHAGSSQGAREGPWRAWARESGHVHMCIDAQHGRCARRLVGVGRLACAVPHRHVCVAVTCVERPAAGFLAMAYLAARLVFVCSPRPRYLYLPHKCSMSTGFGVVVRRGLGQGCSQC